MPIRQLTPDVAAKIAAGEVVERPASVVKELVENALDAGARHIRVELANGGLGLIRVSDDGCGIPSDELPLAFARHATSKVQALGDLERIATLGFRGEALASIAAVAGVTLLSRPRAAARGAQMAVVGGEAGSPAPAGAPAGTTVTVRDLFASMPGRLKFLKTRGTETGRCVQLVEQYALAFPEVRFTVVSEGRQVFTTPGDGKLASVLVAVYGLAVAEHMVPLDGTDDTASAQPEPEHAPAATAAATPRPQVSGYVSRPSCYKSTRGYLSFFVNRRWVQSRTLNFAVEEAYHSLLLTGRHPIAVINVALDPAQLDANVHPAKTEVRFLYERQVFAAVQRAVRAAVLATAEAPEVSSRAFAVPDWSSPAVPASGDGGEAPRASAGNASLWGRTPAGTEGQPGGAAGADAPAAGSDADGFAVPGAADAPVGGRKLPVMRVLGQVSQSYIITEGPDGVYMVDQHAAHERVLLERMIAEWRSRAVSSQLLLQPVPIELAAAERESIEEHLDALAQIGFAIEPFGGDALLVRALPAVLAAQTRPQPLRELLLELAGGGAEAASHGETWEEHALANVACKAAIKAGQTLSPEEQRELIRQLEGASAYQSCCHGRPTMVHLSLSALERQFDRR
ncbi:MAG TPA: DNA mismatch repair endonuclease MutL [Ktedonobacterales bacterium]|nr:DNA mismatch repair endonuclease MutL [Ktedonobacterales bacterium]